MSYTKFSKEVTKWLKANDLPCYGTVHDSPEETKARLDAWMLGMKHSCGSGLQKNDIENSFPVPMEVGIQMM